MSAAPTAMPSWRLAVVVLSAAAYAGFSYWTMNFHARAWWALLLLLAPLWLGALGVVAHRFGRWGAAVVLALGAAALAGWASHGRASDPSLLYVLQHVGIHALLALWFGSSLRSSQGGQEGQRGPRSLIGELAARVHPMSADQWAYTAGVTRMWTAYFALMVCASLGVYALLPFSAWSLLANVLTPLLMAVLFFGEHFMRYRLHPEFERSRVADIVRAYRQLGPLAPAQPGQEGSTRP